MHSGRNPIVQIVKWSSETFAVKHPQQTSGDATIGLKRPNNMFILNDSSCCEVVDMAGVVDENGDQLFVCGVYERTEPLLNSPCDSSLIRVHKGNKHWTSVKTLSSKCLKTKAMLVELGLNKILFMAILHAV